MIGNCNKMVEWPS